MGVRGQDFVGATLDRESQNLLDVTLRAQNAGGFGTHTTEHQALGVDDVPGANDLACFR